MPQIKIINNDVQSVSSIVTDSYSDPINLNGAEFVSVSSDLSVSTPGAVTFEDGTNQRVTVVTLADTGVKETSVVTVVADTGAFQIDQAVYVADVAAYDVETITWTGSIGIVQADYIVCYNQAGVSYAFWADLNASGLQPIGAAYVAATNKIRVAVTSGNSAGTVGATFAAAAAAMANVTVANLGSGNVTLTQTKYGTTTVPSPHNFNDTGAGSVTFVTTLAGANSAINSNYFTFSALDVNFGVHNYAVWFNVGGQGVAPVIGGSPELIPVAVAAGASIATLLAATSPAITASTASGKVIVGSISPNFLITQQFFGVITHAATGGVPFTISTPTPGVGSNLNSTYFTYETRNTGGGSTQQAYGWYNNHGQGTEPSFIPGTSFMIAILPGDSQATIASKTAVAMASDTNAVFTSNSTSFTITNKFMGTATNAANGSPSPAFSYSITQGVASNLLNTYFRVYSPLNATSYVFWNNVNSEGTDPLVTSTTSVPIVLAAGSSNTTVATAIDTAVGTLSSVFTHGIAGHTDTLTLVLRTTASPASDGPGGAATLFTIATPDVGVLSGVNTTSGAFTVTALGSYASGVKVQLTSTGTLPTGFSTSTDYYLISVDSTHVKMAASLADALANIPIIPSDQGSNKGVGTITPVAITGSTFEVQVSNDVLADPDSFVTFGTPSDVTTSELINLSDPLWSAFAWLRIFYNIPSGQLSSTTTTLVKGPN